MHSPCRFPRKRTNSWLGLSFLLVVAIVLASCGEEEPGEQEVEEQEKEEEEIPTLSIGETFRSPEVVVTVSDAITTASYDYYDKASESTVTDEAAPDRSFFIFTAEVENAEKGEEDVAPRTEEGRWRFKVFDSEGKKQMNHLYVGEDALSPYFGTGQELYPGERIEGKVAFLIREGASGLKIVYSEPGFPEKRLVEWKIE